MISFTPILSLLKQPLFWRFIGFISSIVGLLCYALSSSFKLLFGEWNLLKVFLYGVGSFIICSFVLLAKKWQLSRSLMLKAHVGFFVLMLTSVYTFFYDKAVNGKSDVLGLISCAAFALMSFSLSRQNDLGFEVDVLNFFLGCLTVQLMKINMMLAFLGGVFCYFFIVLRSSLNSQKGIGTIGATATDHVAIEIDASNRLEIGADHGRAPNITITAKNHPHQAKDFNRTTADTAAQAEFREHKGFLFSKPEAKVHKLVAAMKIQHAFHNYKTRKTTEAATRIQRTFRAWKIRKDSIYKRQQAIKIQAAFRGFQVRKQYSKILRSVGVIDKAVLQWHLKRRDFRELDIDPVQEMEDRDKKRK